jgi:hypothetical protein
MAAELLKVPVDASPTIRKAAETTSSEFATALQRLNRRADQVLETLFPQFDGRVIPKPLIAIAALRINTLAQYRVVPDEYGLNYKLTFNEKYYNEGENGMEWAFGQWGESETLTHETAHHTQELTGIPYKAGRSAHDEKFVASLEQLGIHSELHSGVHTAPADLDKPFGLLMKRLGIQRPELPPEQVPVQNIDWWKLFFGDERKGKSSLSKWYCSICSFAVRVGIKGDPQLLHEPDGGRFIRG